MNLYKFFLVKKQEEETIQSIKQRLDEERLKGFKQGYEAATNIYEKQLKEKIEPYITNMCKELYSVSISSEKTLSAIEFKVGERTMPDGAVVPKTVSMNHHVLNIVFSPYSEVVGFPEYARFADSKKG